MKLFLSSLSISDTQAIELATLVGKAQKDIKLALIENAADVDAVEPEWLKQNRTMIQSHEFDVEIIDIRDYRGKLPELEEKLGSKDVIWCGGGNTYYLRWLLKETGVDQLITRLVNQGTVYGGGSAGAIMAGPTLKHFETADDPNDAPEVLLDGLGFTDKVIVPHMDNQKFASIIHAINDNLKADGYATVPLTDSQAFIVKENQEKVIG